MNIKTNHQTRPVLSGFELPESVKSEFDYYQTESDLDSGSFFKYKGQYYDLSQFVSCNIKCWQCCHNESYFSGLFVKFTDDLESVIVASYYS
jgi:hypothetical protein